MSKKEEVISAPKNKFVFLRRKRSFVVGAQDQKDVDEWESNARVEIGAYFDKTGSPGTGLNPMELQILMQEYLHLSKTDDRALYYTKLTEFYNNIFSQVPPREGLRLNIGFTRSDLEPFATYKVGTEEFVNMPLELLDYIKYRHHISHPDVAVSVSQAHHATVSFVLYDPNEAEEEEKKQLDIKDKAMQVYLKIKTNVNVKKYVMVLKKELPRYNQIQKRLELTAGGILQKIAMEEPVTFVKVCSDPDVILRFDFYHMIHHKLLHVTAGMIHFPESTDSIAGNMTELVMWSKKEENSKKMLELKKQLKEIRATR